MISPSAVLQESNVNKLRLLRWKARTDLVWFCNNVLGYPDINEKVHGPFIRNLQKFPKPSEAELVENDQYLNGKWVYKPLRPMLELEGKRRMLLLDPRGNLKTSCNVIAHTIQWIINYPDIAVAVIQSNLDKASDFTREIKNHFTRNPVFRELFPEHCPILKKANDWGTAESFVTEARGRACTRREPTVRAASIEKGLAGSHFDLIKYSDIVDETNSLNDISCKSIFDKFALSLNLLVSGSHWADVEGTRYSDADAYGEIIKGQLAIPEEKRDWNIFVRGVFEKDTKGKPRRYSPEEVELPDLLDAEGKPVSIWPERHKVDEIMSRYLLNPYITSAQMFNYPNRAIGGQTIFPITDSLPKWKTRKDFKDHVWVSHWEITVDTAETTNLRSNYSVITVGAWDQAGRLYIVDIKRGKWLAAELIARLVGVWMQTKALSKNGYVRVRIEETGYVRGLMYGLKQYLDQRGLYMDIQPFKVNNQKSKAENITNTLQTPYKTGQLIFLDDLTEKEALLEELKKAPFPPTDDILDTLAAFYKDKEWLGRLQQRPETRPFELPINQDREVARRQKMFETALGLTDVFGEAQGGPAYDTNHPLTGGL